MLRTIVMTERKVDAQFSYKNLFRIFPPPEDAQLSDTEFGWPYPCIIEFENDKDLNNIERFGKEIPPVFEEQNLSRTILSETLNLMSLFTIYRFFQYKGEHSWLCTPKTFQLHYGFSDYVYSIDENYEPPSCPQIDMLEGEKYYKYDCLIDMNMRHMCFPDILPVLLDIYYKLDNKKSTRRKRICR